MPAIQTLSDLLNSDIDTLEYDLGDIVHDAASRLASSANNEGVSGQVDFLRNTCGWNEKTILEALNDNRSD